MEKRNFEILEEYFALNFYEEINKKEKLPYSFIMDMSDVIPGEIEMEDELKEYSLWRKFNKNSK